MLFFFIFFLGNAWSVAKIQNQADLVVCVIVGSCILIKFILITLKIKEDS